MKTFEQNSFYEQAVLHYSDTLFRVAMHHSSRTADAEDAVQDVFIRLLQHGDNFENEEHLKAWLLRVTINRCHDLTRAAHNKDTELPETLPLKQDDRTEILDAVARLPQNYRDAIYLHYYEGYTAAEIGEILQKPTNTILSWLRRARAQLSTFLQEELYDDLV